MVLSQPDARVRTMEQAVEGIHQIVRAGILLPDLGRLNRMESNFGLLAEEVLHIGDLNESVIEVHKTAVPRRCPALLNTVLDSAHVDDVVICNFRHQLREDDFINAGETLCINDAIHIQLHETLRQAHLILNLRCDVEQRLAALLIHPTCNEVIAMRFIGRSNIVVQPCQIFRSHRLGSRSQQDMGCQRQQVALSALITRHLRHHTPEGIIGLKLADALIQFILFSAQVII